MYTKQDRNDSLNVEVAPTVPAYVVPNTTNSATFFNAAPERQYTDDEKFIRIANEYGINEKSRAKLYTCAGSCFPVIVIDDSGSMSNLLEFGQNFKEKNIKTHVFELISS